MSVGTRSIAARAAADDAADGRRDDERAEGGERDGQDDDGALARHAEDLRRALLAVARGGGDRVLGLASGRDDDAVEEKRAVCTYRVEGDGGLDGRGSGAVGVALLGRLDLGGGEGDDVIGALASLGGARDEALAEPDGLDARGELEPREDRRAVSQVPLPSVAHRAGLPGKRWYGGGAGVDNAPSGASRRRA